MTSSRKLLATFGAAAAIASGAALLPTATPQADAARTYWGAVAYHSNGSYAGAVDYPTRAAAIRAVRARCGGYCGYISYANSCGAVAFSRFRVGASGGYPNRASAERAARRKAGYGARVRVYACTTRYR
ncbi:DUF4189 domain-containing protein [Gordonia sp. (in: high G+C Gram-positive bacteria)]|uniref:DUF4189 domain-containing protein n=1 Tax=Gordonia sp. (in: high G+C Gram-positive bacteria) TaxID=84139 RepID=UPI0039E214A5